MTRFRSRFALRLGLVIAAASPVLATGFTVRPPVARQAPAPRVVAIGDIHGAFDSYVEILQTAGLVDDKLRWTGGTTVYVQTGDVLDRGPKVRETLDLLIRLEEEAKRAGGRVEFLLGNHEAMNLLHEFRDGSAAAYAGFADPRSEARRQRAFDDYARFVKRRATPGEAAPVRDAWMAAHPAGFVEYVEALGPRGKYGRWLRARKVVTTEGRTAFMHAGVSMAMTGTFDDINRTAAREIAEWDATLAMMVRAQIVPAFCTLSEAVEAAVAELQRISAASKASEPPGDHVTREFFDALKELLEVGTSSLLNPEGPFWSRGFALWPETPETATAKVTPLLTRFGVDRFVTSHTPTTTGRVVSRFDSRLILIDTGAVFKGGRASALELQDGRITAIYTDARTPIVPAAATYVPRETFSAAFPRAFFGVADAAASPAASRY